MIRQQRPPFVDPDDGEFPALRVAHLVVGPQAHTTQRRIACGIGPFLSAGGEAHQDMALVHLLYQTQTQVRLGFAQPALSRNESIHHHTRPTAKWAGIVAAIRRRRGAATENGGIWCGVTRGTRP